MREPYQMDLFDLEEKEYQPVQFKLNPFAISMMYKCPKCGAVVGHYIDNDGWSFKHDKCQNGHNLKWEAIK